MSAPTVPDLPHTTGSRGLVEVSTGLGWCDIFLDFRGEPRAEDSETATNPVLSGAIRGGPGTPTHTNTPTGRTAWTFECPKIHMWQDRNGVRYAISFLDNIPFDDLSSADEDPYGRTGSTILPLMFNRSVLARLPGREARACFDQWTPSVEALAHAYVALARQGIPIYAGEAALDLALAGLGMRRGPVADRLAARYGAGIAFQLAWWRVHGYDPETIDRYVHMFDIPDDERSVERGVPSGDLHTLVRWLDGAEPALHGIPRKTVVGFFLADTVCGMDVTGDPQHWTPALIREMYDLGLCVPSWWSVIRRAHNAESGPSGPGETDDADGSEQQRLVMTLPDYVRAWATHMPLEHAMYFMADRVPLALAASTYQRDTFNLDAYRTLWSLAESARSLPGRFGEGSLDDLFDELQREIDQTLATTLPAPRDGFPHGCVGDPYPTSAAA